MLHKQILAPGLTAVWRVSEFFHRAGVVRAYRRETLSSVGFRDHCVLQELSTSWSA